MIREWSYGEVKKPETINYRTLKPERDGLFCERIFGPTKDWECHCGKYKRSRAIRARSAKSAASRLRPRQGPPRAHGPYRAGRARSRTSGTSRAIPSRMGLLLDISPELLEKVLYFAQYIVIDPGRHAAGEEAAAYREAVPRLCMKNMKTTLRAGMGAEAIKKLLEEIDLEKLSASYLKEELQTAQRQQKRPLHQAAGGGRGVPALGQPSRVDDPRRRCRSSRRTSARWCSSTAAGLRPAT